MTNRLLAVGDWSEQEGPEMTPRQCIWDFGVPPKSADVHPIANLWRWSRSSWQMSYSIHWCLGSYIGVRASVTHLDTSLHHVCMISVLTTTLFCVYVCAGHLAPLQRHLKTRLGDCKRPNSVFAELWERVHKGWEAIAASVCQNLILNMPRRFTIFYRQREAIQSTRMLGYCFLNYKSSEVTKRLVYYPGSRGFFQ